MSEQDVTIAQALNQDSVDESAGRVEKGVDRAKAYVALIDGATLFLAHLWTVLAAIAAPLFALFAKHAHGEVENSTEPTGDPQS